MDMQINYLAVLAAGISAMVIGALWYGPLFGKTWASLMGFTDESMKSAKERGMGKSYAIMFVGALLEAFVLAHFANVWIAIGFAGAFQLAFWLWLGFIVPILAGQVLWENKPVKLYLINIKYHLVSLVIMSLIIVFWK